MNQLFDGRWSLLSPGYNVPKRVLHHAPALWKQLVEDKEIVFLHYMGEWIQIDASLKCLLTCEHL